MENKQKIGKNICHRFKNDDGLYNMRYSLLWNGEENGMKECSFCDSSVTIFKCEEGERNSYELYCDGYQDCMFCCMKSGTLCFSSKKLAVEGWNNFYWNCQKGKSKYAK